MATYVIGDVHGCFDELQQLIALIKFQPQVDKLWFTGDLVNGGNKSIETINFVRQLGTDAICVLGNHDLTLLGIALGITPGIKYTSTSDAKYTAALKTTPCTTAATTPGDSLVTVSKITSLENSSVHTAGYTDILTLPSKQLDTIISWLRTRPLVHYDSALNTLLVHAGVAPQWDIATTLSLGKEIEAILSGNNATAFLGNMFGNYPTNWDDRLTGWDRSRCIVNYMTRLRFCKENGELELATKGKAADAPADTKPWFTIPNRKTQQTNIVFGHWAALEGKTGISNVFAVDTGCVWGNKLTALRLEDKQLFSVNSMTHNATRTF